ncbi:rab effector Noc2 isoform X3 [Heterocephalus glaber]|uniref:Rab effector Noc2 isoform X3 n=1 Tax=Heterocephalus glaber TaxID=10181 RepID=A0AAX6RC06_HETGA|nr:rab effector Noc2 isoform X3 [Heterocephalus glaber]
MADTIFGSGNDQWVCPNDRQLALRAKLQTGWSVHTYQTEKQRRSQRLSPAEMEAILQVIQRAERLDTLEQQRIGCSDPKPPRHPGSLTCPTPAIDAVSSSFPAIHSCLLASFPLPPPCYSSFPQKPERLVERLETMRQNVMGNGLSQCLLCGEVLGFLGSSSVFCRDCRKKVCTKCGIEASPGQKRPLWLCKICSEQREWFPATVTVTQISALPAWRTDSRPLGRGTKKATNRWGRQVAAWSLPGWGSPAHPATSRGARAAWPGRLGQALQTHRGTAFPSLSPGALAKDKPGRLPAADVAFEGGLLRGANLPVGD